MSSLSTLIMMSKILLCVVVAAIGACTAAPSCVYHIAKDKEFGSKDYCCYTRTCPAGTQPVCNASTEPYVVCDKCLPYTYKDKESSSVNMETCDEQPVCNGPEWIAANDETALAKTVCWCNTAQGYQPVNKTNDSGKKVMECVLVVRTTPVEPAVTGVDNVTINSTPSDVGRMNLVPLYVACGIIVGLLAVGLIVFGLIVLQRCHCRSQANKTSGRSQGRSHNVPANAIERRDMLPSETTQV